MRKVQSQLIMSLVTRRRADALALIRNEPRAEVWRLAIEGEGLAAMERTHAGALAELEEIGKFLGMTGLELAEKAMAERLTMDAVRALTRADVTAPAA